MRPHAGIVRLPGHREDALLHLAMTSVDSAEAKVIRAQGAPHPAGVGPV